MSSLTDIQKKFLSAPLYAVVGASKDQSKYGTKVGFLQQASRIRSLIMPSGTEVVPGQKQGRDSGSSGKSHGVRYRTRTTRTYRKKTSWKG